MSSRISELLEEIRVREEELEDIIGTYQVNFFYQLEGTKVKFEQAVMDAHRKLRVSIYRWLRNSSIRNVLSVPFIYAMIVPFVFIDISISIYQYICFTLYKIPKVDRRKFIVIDRHRLAYLNAIEKFNCVYCGYANGVISYSREIAARTEQYWCPIKHARKVLDPHRRYARFSDFGDSAEYTQYVEDMRKQIRAE